MFGPVLHSSVKKKLQGNPQNKIEYVVCFTIKIESTEWNIILSYPSMLLFSKEIDYI